MKGRKKSYWIDDEPVDRGIIVVVDGLAFGPFQLPEQALGWALQHKPDNIYKLMPLLNPSIVGD